MAVAAVDELGDLLDRTANDPAADPAARVATLRSLRSDLAALVGIADKHIGDQELRRESSALDRVRQYMGARAEANARGGLLDDGVASPEALDGAGVLSHDELDRRMADGSIEEAIMGLPDDLELRETWSEAARVAALAARRKKAALRKESEPGPSFGARARELDSRVASAVERARGLNAPASPGTHVRDSGPVPDVTAAPNPKGAVSQKRLLAAAKSALTQPSTVDVFSHTDPETGKRVYDQSRQELHQRIIEKALKGAKSQRKPRVLFMGGGYASGKGTMRRRLEAQGKVPKDAVMLDPDEIKAQLPEFKQMTGEGDPEANLATYEEAWDISQALQHEAQKRKVNMVVDGLGNTSPEDMLARVKSFRDAGYHHAAAHYVSAPTDQAVERAGHRAANATKPEDRRVIPVALMRATHRDVSASLPGIIEGSREPDKGLDELHIHDTSVQKGPDGKEIKGAEPKTVYSLKNGVEQVHDPEGLKKVLAKADEKVAGVDAPAYEQGGTKDLGRIFDEREMAAGKAPQPVKNVDELYKQAEETHPAFGAIMHAVGSDLGGHVHDQEKNWEDAVAANPDHAHVAIAPLKGRARAQEKIAGKYKGDASALNDVVRGTVTVPHVSDLEGAVKSVRANLPDGWSIVAPENRYAAKDGSGVNVGPTEAGYRDVAVLLRSPDGHQSELQITTAPMLAAKSGEGHKLYEKTRVLRENAKAENRSLSPEEMDAVNAADKRAAEVYNGAHAASSGAPDPGRDGWKPFMKLTPDSTVMPISELTPSAQDSEEHVAKAGAFMDKTAKGEMALRKPLTGRREADGSVTITDGKSTLEQLKRRGVTHAPVAVQEQKR